MLVYGVSRQVTGWRRSSGGSSVFSLDDVRGGCLGLFLVILSFLFYFFFLFLFFFFYIFFISSLVFFFFLTLAIVSLCYLIFFLFLIFFSFFLFGDQSVTCTAGYSDCFERTGQSQQREKWSEPSVPKLGSSVTTCTRASSPLRGVLFCYLARLPTASTSHASPLFFFCPARTRLAPPLPRRSAVLISALATGPPAGVGGRLGPFLAA